MARNGERSSERGSPESRRATPQLADLGIPRDRASRAMQLADVPQDQFDAALAAALDN